MTMIDHGGHVWSVPSALALMPGVALPLRTTVLRDSEGGLVVVSPVAGVEQWGREVDNLGPVRSVVAPNGFHHLFARAAWERYPQATLWASGALRRKRPDFPGTTRWLEGAGPVTVAPGIVAYPVLGMAPVQEWVFLHEGSRTLVVTDLLFNVLEPGFGLGIFQRLFGTYKRLAVSRLFVGARKDRAAYDASLTAIAALPFERVVMAHGEPILAGARTRVAEALAASP
jgi:hypothetical protein